MKPLEKITMRFPYTAKPVLVSSMTRRPTTRDLMAMVARLAEPGINTMPGEDG